MAGAGQPGVAVSMAMSGAGGLPTLAPAPHNMHPAPQLHMQGGPAPQPGGQMTMQPAPASMAQPAPAQAMGQPQFQVSCH